MLLRHLRDNLVAYLALVVALGGTSYAAVQIPRGSVTAAKLAPNAVTTPKIKKNAVTGAKIKSRSVPGVDLRVGVVPKDGFVLGTLVSNDDPVAVPDVRGLTRPTVTLPRSGTAYVRYFSGQSGATCTAGIGYGGMYVDGAPVPGTRRTLPAALDRRAIELVSMVPLGPGAHELSYGVDCPSGSISAAYYDEASWTVLVPAS